MLEPRGHADLPKKTFGAERGGELRAEELEGDGPVVTEVVGEVDQGHAAAAELAVEPVAAGKGGREAGGRVGQRGVRSET
ncbi:MAG TPA: hypothetical protein VFG66_01545 [Gemmatimonadales bacterium]|nr:hypothetical protein [Gemmatimonadales bacterium]